MRQIKGVMNTKMDWGEEPEFFGPRHYFREGLILRNIRHYVPKQGRILDAGSGNGSLSIRMGKAGYPDILGIDYSDAFIVYAGERARKEKLDAVIRFQKGNLLEPAAESACFDAVVSGEVLEHLEDDRKAVKKFYGALKSGGLCIATVPANPKLWDKNDEWAGHFRRYTKAQLEQLFEDNGFHIIRCTYWGFPLIRLFHKFIYLPIVDRKVIKGGENISRDRSLLFRLLKNEHLHRLGAKIFLFDNLFNFLPFGPGLLIVARKP